MIFNGSRLYLSVILDLCNKEIVAYKVSRSNGFQLVLDTAEKASKKRDVKKSCFIVSKDFNIHPSNITNYYNLMELTKYVK
ncbi:hypothetical protein KPL50_19130 [Clostridium sp. CF012]|nr:hypothetical protein [Clostridium sp. CF012]MBU3145633.1 hypothetical protein [Clostridium sp. CF012]